MTDLRLPQDARLDGRGVPALLLGGRWEAFTEQIWFLEAPLDDAIRGMREGHDPSVFPKRTVTALHGSLEELLRHLEPWAVPSSKVLLVEMGGWSALFSQASTVYMCEVAAGALGTRCLRTIHRPRIVRDGRALSAGACIFVLSQARAVVRTLWAEHDVRWKWRADGEVQPFEDESAYASKQIAKRFDLAALERYCAALGVRRMDASAYGPRALLIEQDSSTWARRRSMSAAEWLQQHR
jgi:hypothetical protein